MEKACGNVACTNTFSSSNNRKKFCSAACYPSVIATAAAKRLGRGQKSVVPAPAVSLPAASPIYAESSPSSPAARSLDTSWAPSPSGPNHDLTSDESEHSDDPSPLLTTQRALDATGWAAYPVQPPTSTQVSDTNLSVDASLRFNQPPWSAGTAITLPLDSETESDGSDDDADETVDSTLSPAEAFFNLWAPVFLGCSNREDVDLATESCAADWHRLTKKSDDLTASRKQVVQERSRNSPVAHRRQQSRQQQRIKKKDNTKKKEEAGRIQALFKRFPKRAVRKVLGETSQAYTGSVEAATDFLKGAYEQPHPSEAAVLKARRVYDGCSWSNPSEEELEHLASPPARSEIARKLKRASNTAPGADGVEYKDISRLDPECRLLEVLYAAVWRLGVPNSMVEALSLTSGILPENLHKTNFKKSHVEEKGLTDSHQVRYLVWNLSAASLESPFLLP
ncbi:hypothetical protein DAPPUDRAFT_111874 [Daphnia pulex]|uniref:Uncharacterized protein n=1 Tax=Daphnia pulex TaxID=6669 RepID=E9HAC8_DAPPU|nr:hypothetical protein DAPPUDRAFT_111874 [Daphnia pulex]|eukprot:EFX71317.1 hypothetical protein DAPPUDRAFT_111874 [Daphnia pulex]